MTDDPDVYLGPLCDEPPLDDGESITETDAVPSNCLYLPAPLPKKPGELEKLEQAYRYAKHLPPVIFDEPADDET